MNNRRCSVAEPPEVNLFLHSSRASGGIIKFSLLLGVHDVTLAGLRFVGGFYPAVALRYTAGYSSCRR
ncbi:MAG: hypothetical protein LBC02_02205 [Planctomycetaceae bacterium]|jgi:hypothetical protein|nr:hypothetical protein [Planctomycetaceae bacterium]